ncbi:MAG: apolipoprotein N-acyltransferase [Acidobacteriota bacterium]|jgi:apolipoprotein N-acyltransferase|nr:apolipoprotein N-acyltransferase [Acidobacteriota bacterium]
MDDALSLDAPVRERLRVRLRRRARAFAPTRVEVFLSILSAALLVCSFPDFNLWPLAWVGLAPLFVAVARRPQRGSSFLLGWITGTLFFYGSCYWVTYPMIRYGGIPAWIAFLLFVIPTLIVGLFPAMCCMVLARAVARWGLRALFLAPALWAALEWMRLGITGLLWDAIGYSQAYAPPLIQTARWGGVYLVGFLIVTVNAALAQIFLERSARAARRSAAAMLGTAVLIFAAYLSARSDTSHAPSDKPAAVVVAVQPDVPMDPGLSEAEIAALIERHYSLSEGALQNRPEAADVPRVVIWPESPMNFRYAGDTQFRELVANFAAKNHTSVLFNSQEPAPANGTYNSAVMVNEEGRLVAQYDKIRLLPFGEYVPLPRWLPGVSSIPAMVGDFTPGAEYTLMPLGEARTGVFICFESAFPSIARHFAEDGADVLVNISNDGYLGETPVMRQHLANTVFRAVENARPVLRVTNTGITAFITARGEVLDATAGFQPAVRTWTVHRATNGKTFYTRFGDMFAGLCALMSLGIVVLSWRKKRRT